jgi:hypothetical protein
MKEIPMTEKATHKPYDLENRTFKFAKHVRLVWPLSRGRDSQGGRLREGLLDKP